MSQSTMAVLNDTVLYEIKNLDETIKYCMMTNRFLESRNFEVVKSLFLAEIQESFDKAVNENNISFLSSQQQVYGAFFYLDLVQNTTLNVDDRTFGPNFYQLNFFVRLGKEVIN